MALLTGVMPVLAIAMKNRRKAIVDVDAIAQAQAEASLNILKADWLTVEYAAWAAALYPPI